VRTKFDIYVIICNKWQSPTSDYIKNSIFLTIDLMGILWLFLSGFVTLKCDVGNDDDGICKITLPRLYVL